MADAVVNLGVIKMSGGGGAPEGWKLSPSNQTFAYRFTGGNTGRNNGDLSFVVDGQRKKIKFRLDNNVSDGFSLYNIGFFNDDHSLSTDFDKAKISGRKGTVIDDDGEVSSGYLKVWVEYRAGIDAPTTRIECDPRWENQA